jgi:glycogen debranching enzyme
MRTHLIRKIDIARAQNADPRQLLRREWLITNGLGGYASGTISGMVSRRYHGLLIAALPAPHGRVMMFNHLSETLHLPDGKAYSLVGMRVADRMTRQSNIMSQNLAWKTDCRLGASKRRVMSFRSKCC